MSRAPFSFHTQNDYLLFLNWWIFRSLRTYIFHSKLEGSRTLFSFSFRFSIFRFFVRTASRVSSLDSHTFYLLASLMAFCVWKSSSNRARKSRWCPFAVPHVQSSYAYVRPHIAFASNIFQKFQITFAIYLPRLLCVWRLSIFMDARLGSLNCATEFFSAVLWNDGSETNARQQCNLMAVCLCSVHRRRGMRWDTFAQCFTYPNRL